MGHVIWHWGMNVRDSPSSTEAIPSKLDCPTKYSRPESQGHQPQPKGGSRSTPALVWRVVLQSLWDTKARVYELLTY